MAHLLFKTYGNKYINHSFFKPYLYIYEDLMVYKKRKWGFMLDEITMAYNHVVAVNMHKGLLFSNLEMILSGGQNSVVIKGVWNRHAKKAKKLMDQKIYDTHHKQHHMKPQDVKQDMEEEHTKIGKFEKSLYRLRELVNRGRLTEKEFEKKKKELLKKLH